MHRSLGLVTVLGAHFTPPFVRRCLLFDSLVDVIAGPLEIQYANILSLRVKSV